MRWSACAPTSTPQDCGGDGTCVADRRRTGSMALRPNEQFFQFQRQRFEREQQEHQQQQASFFGSGSASRGPFTGLGAAFESLPAARALRIEVMRHVNRYLAALGHQQQQQQQQQQLADDAVMFMWATVHDSCVGHLPHVHQARVCAVPTSVYARA